MHSTNGTPIERILTSSALGPTRQAVPPADLQQQLQQQHSQPGLSASDNLMHDPIWNPGAAPGTSAVDAPGTAQLRRRATPALRECTLSAGAPGRDIIEELSPRCLL